MEFSGTVQRSAMRLYAEGRAHIATDARVIYVDGDHGTRYRVVIDGDDYDCTCPATVACKHVGAALLELRDV
jgi:uncharacterized Zn finger protein